MNILEKWGYAMSKATNTDINDVMIKIGADGLAEQYTQLQKSKNNHNNKSKTHNTNDVADPSVQQLLDQILSNIEKVDFESMTKLQLSDEQLASYIKSGNINLPKRIIAVLVIDHVLDTANNCNVEIRKHYDQLDSVYIFNGKYWVMLTSDILNKFLQASAIKMGYNPLECKTNNFHELLGKTFWRSNHLQSIESNNKHDISYINFNNCTLKITSTGFEVVPHNKEYFLLYKLDFDYDESATVDMFQKYLDRVLPEPECQTLLLEALGYIFIKNLKLEKMIVLLGGGSNGKSVIFDIVCALLGEHNITPFSLSELSEPYNRAKLDGKLVNYSSEIDSGKMNTDILKRLISGEPVQARLLHQNTFIMRNPPKFICNANGLPNTKDHTFAYFRRFLIISFDQTINENEADPQLAKKIITSELSGIMNMVIVGAKRLLQNKKFSACAKSDQELAKYQKESDVVALFLDDNWYQPSLEIKDMEFGDLYNEFKSYCIENNHFSLSNIRFSKRIQALGYKIVRGSKNKLFVYITKK